MCGSVLQHVAAGSYPGLLVATFFALALLRGPVAVCCSGQCVAVCCIVLLARNACCHYSCPCSSYRSCCSMLQCVASCSYPGLLVANLFALALFRGRVDRNLAGKNSQKSAYCSI